ncbi:MerR family transcriptional regulator [Devosia sp.]|uniref:MerR family transcriptional regulator n=1 Tax=Devosia sp. TaxID=1871048 RepID=UPI001B249931|nr:MerR family transcriptional regulator [Devosia sp.]MBO9589882.1 MerR family transcriptional regulator [Devosia sp.]
MTHPEQVLSPAEAARALGISAKALRLYEQRGLITPIRNANGWRHYGPKQMAGIRQIVALRTLGLSLSQIAAVLAGKSHDLDKALAEHQSRLEGNLTGLLEAIERVRIWRNDLSGGRAPDLADLIASPPALSLTLPWPWNGELFELKRLAPVTYLVGPLGSGKTRLAIALAETLGGGFVGLDRGEPSEIPAAALRALEWLLEDGAVDSPALRAVVAGMVSEDRPRVIDLVEDGLDEATQLALGGWLRRRSEGDAPLVVMTRSSAVLDLDAVSAGHAILFCPPNHSVPFEVLAVAGSPGYESVSNCLGTPEARARTAGMVVRMS